MYWRCSWDLRYSGGRWEGGCKGGYLARGGVEMFICSIDGAGAIAAAVEAYLQVYGDIRGTGIVARRHLGHCRNRDGILLKPVCPLM